LELKLSFKFPADLEKLAMALFGAIFDVATKAYDVVKKQYLKWSEDLKAKVTKYLDDAKNLDKVFKKGFDEVKQACTGALGDSADAIKKAGEVISSPFGDLDKQLANLAKDTAKALGNGVKDAGKAVGKAAKDTGKAVGKTAKKTWKAMKKFR